MYSSGLDGLRFGNGSDHGNLWSLQGSPERPHNLMYRAREIGNVSRSGKLNRDVGAKQRGVGVNLAPFLFVWQAAGTHTHITKYILKATIGIPASSAHSAFAMFAGFPVAVLLIGTASFFISSMGSSRSVHRSQQASPGLDGSPDCEQSDHDRQLS